MANPGLEIQCNLRVKIKVTPKLNWNKGSLPRASSPRNGSFFALVPKLYSFIPANLCKLGNNNILNKEQMEMFMKELDACIRNNWELFATMLAILIVYIYIQGSTIDQRRVYVHAYALKNLGIRHVQAKNCKK